MSILDDFDNKFLVSQLLLFSVGNWRISVRPAQPTIGSLILSLGRECHSLGDFTEQEGVDFSLACKNIEHLFQSTFSPDKLNYLALMMIDPQLHFHILPRYSRPIEFLGVKYTDSCWSGPPDITASLPVSAGDVHEYLTAHASNVSESPRVS